MQAAATASLVSASPATYSTNVINNHFIEVSRWYKGCIDLEHGMFDSPTRNRTKRMKSGAYSEVNEGTMPPSYCPCHNWSSPRIVCAQIYLQGFCQWTSTESAKNIHLVKVVLSQSGYLGQWTHVSHERGTGQAFQVIWVLLVRTWATVEGTPPRLCLGIHFHNRWERVSIDALTIFDMGTEIGRKRGLEGNFAHTYLLCNTSTVHCVPICTLPDD
jgi:hypothetical protein